MKRGRINFRVGLMSLLFYDTLWSMFFSVFFLVFFLVWINISSSSSFTWVEAEYDIIPDFVSLFTYQNGTLHMII